MNRKNILEKMIYLTIIFLPAYLLKLDGFGVPTNFLEMMILAVIILSFWEENYSQRALALLREMKNYFWGSVLIIIGLIISTLINSNYFAGLGILKGWFVLPMLFAFTAELVLDGDKRKNVYTSYYLSAFFVALISLGYLVSGNLTYDGRLRAFFNSPNYLAMYLAPALITILVQVQSSKFKVQNYKSKFFSFIFMISLLVIIAAFFFTYSYAAWLAVGLASGIVFMESKRINKKQVILGSLIIFFLFMIQINTSKFNNIIYSGGRSSLDSRLMIWQSAGKMLEVDWLFGIGAGNFQERYLANQKYFSPYLEWAVPHPHNIFLAFWLYSGFSGLVGFLCIIVMFFKKIRLKIKNDSLARISAAIILYILIHGSIDTTYFKNDLAIVFWLAVLFSSRKSENNSENKADIEKTRIIEK